MINVRGGKKKRPRESEDCYIDIVKHESLDKDAHDEDIEHNIDDKNDNRGVIEEILFKLPIVEDPLVGTPKEVQKQLDGLVKLMQKTRSEEKNSHLFNKIHLYMHGYLINVVLRQFPYIKGYQTVDIYQETLIALRFKAIPNFKENKGMSFLNFSKMCIRRHLITLLNASKNRLKDQSINQAISLDSTSTTKDGENCNTLSNIIADKGITVDKMTESSESFSVTKNSLISVLSEFERVVVEEYLAGAPYKEIAKNVSKKIGKRCKTKSIDNALLRIRKKAIYLQEHSKKEDLPLFII